jgi:tRNA (mo5U34)-methyltransferase
MRSGHDNLRVADHWTPSRMRAEIAQRTWFHTIDLGGGIFTAGQKDTPAEVVHMRLPDLTGRTVLDVGACDGFYSFEAERRGAKDVLATDSWTWNWPGSDARRNFDLAHELLGSTVRVQEVAVEDLAPEVIGGTFDIVLFLGVLYHAPDSLGYLKRVRTLTAEMAIIETLVDLLDANIPAAAYYPGASLNHDGSNHFGPNPMAVEGMLADAGFGRVVALEPWETNPWYSVPPAGEINPTTLAAKARHRLRQRFGRPRSGRMVFHAYV